MKKLLCVLLTMMLLTLPCLACGEQAYQMFAFPGQIEFTAFSDGDAYVKSVVNYPQSALYKYTPGSAEAPQMLLDTLEAESDYTLIAGDQIFIVKDGSAVLNTADENKAFDLPNVEWVPFLMSIFANDDLAFLMYEEETESIHVCYYNIKTEEFKSVSMGENLYTIQPYKPGMTMLFMMNGVTGCNDIYVIDWATMTQTAMGSLPAGVTSIAYNEKDDSVYYLAEGNLCKFSWDGSVQQLASGFPLWTDQRAYILDAGVFATTYIDAEENLLTIPLPN